MVKLNIGDQINGFVILEPIPDGSMANLFKIKDLHTNKILVFKYYGRSLGTRLYTLFLRGIDIAKKLSGSRYFPEFYSTGVIGDLMQLPKDDVDYTRPFVIMEYIHGRSFNHAFNESSNLSSREFGLESILRAMHSSACAYETMHSKNIVHGDPKSKNLMLDFATNVVVVDFDFSFEGTSIESHDKKVLTDPDTLSNGNLLYGTLIYCSPEHFNNRLGHGVTQYSDIWGLGCVFYRMLIGKLPFCYKIDYQFRYSVQNDLPSSLDEEKIDKGISQLVYSCLEKHWYNRPNAAELRQGLEQIMVKKGIRWIDTAAPTDSPL